MLTLCTLTRDCRARGGALVLAVVTAIVPVSLLASQAPVPAREAPVQVQERDGSRPAPGEAVQIAGDRENAERMRVEMEAMMHTLREIERNMAVYGIGLEWRLTSLADVRHRTDATEMARQLRVLREARESLQRPGMERRGDRVPEPPVDPPDRR